MKRGYTLYAIRYTPYLVGLLLLSGCVVRTYPVTKDRVDQDLRSGNRGYLKGVAKEEGKDKKTTRTVQIVEVELYPLVRFEKMPKEKYTEKPGVEKREDDTLWGNRGYISESSSLETAPSVSAGAVSEANMEKYTVEKGDTLQKISKKLYGTTKRWMKIYEANKDKLKAPDRIYPGQVINIPLEPLQETKENLK